MLDKIGGHEALGISTINFSSKILITCNKAIKPQQQQCPHQAVKHLPHPIQSIQKSSSDNLTSSPTSPEPPQPDRAYTALSTPGFQKYSSLSCEEHSNCGSPSLCTNAIFGYVPLSCVFCLSARILLEKSKTI